MEKQQALSREKGLASGQQSWGLNCSTDFDRSVSLSGPRLPHLSRGEGIDSTISKGLFSSKTRDSLTFLSLGAQDGRISLL